jgi:hypothetical protein
VTFENHCYVHRHYQQARSMSNYYEHFAAAYVCGMCPELVSHVPLPRTLFDVSTALEVLEHQHDPLPLAREAVRIAARFVIVTVPSKEDDNPEHIQLFTGESLNALLFKAGAQSVKIDYVLNHMIAIARTS